MRKGKTAAAAYLALGFTFISFVALVVEPQLGLVEPSDRFDPDKLSAVASLPIMIVGNAVILGFAFALACLAAVSADGYSRAAGLIGAFGFLMLACLGQVAAGVPTLIDNSGHQAIAQVSLAAVRMAFLKASVLPLGVVAWRSTLEETGQGNPFAWRALGLFILAGSIAFVFVTLPLPLLFTLWAAWYAFRSATAG